MNDTKRCQSVRHGVQCWLGAKHKGDHHAGTQVWRTEAPTPSPDPWPAWAIGCAQELREVVDTLNLCIDALEGRDGADVCTDLAVATHRIDMVSEAVALALDVPSTLTEDHAEH